MIINKCGEIVTFMKYTNTVYCQNKAKYILEYQIKGQLLIEKQVCGVHLRSF